MVGGCALLVDFGTLVGLKELIGVHYLVAAAVAFMLGLSANYLLAIRYVFPLRRPRGRFAEFVLYGAVGLAGLLITEMTLWALTARTGLHYTLAKAVATLLVFFSNFFMRRYLLTAECE